MKKRFWAVALAAAMLTTSAAPAQLLPPVEVQAANNNSSTGTEDTSTTEGVTVGGFLYTVSNNGEEATITGYNGTAKDITIPTKIKFTASGDADAKDDSNAISYNVTAIAANAFSGKLGIESLTMQGGMDSEGKQYGIEKVGDRAFFGCQHLAKITIAPTTASIGTETFADCVALNSITVTEGNKYYTSIDNALYSYSVSSGTGGYTLVQYPLGNTAVQYTVPASIATTLTAIGPGAFWGSPYLETVTVPSTVTAIGADAFAECKFLTAAEIPEGVTTIGSGAFSGCTGLLSAEIPNGVSMIPASMFKDCESLKTVTLPESVTVINTEAFYNCRQLKEVVVPGSVTTIGDRAFANCSNLQQATIPVRTTAFGSGVFSGSPVTVRCHSGSRAHTYATSNGLTVVSTHTVSFYADAALKNLLSSQEVVDGGSATPPVIDEREGYQFTWSGSYTNVTADTTLYPVWDQYFTVTFIDDYNERSVSHEVKAGSYAPIPSWSMSGYTLYWDNSAVIGAINANMTAHAVWRNDTTGNEVGQNTVRPKSKGTNFEKGNNKYEVTSANVERPTVKFTGLANPSGITTVTVPKTVAYGGVTYYVTAIAAKSLRNNRKIKNVYIGAWVEIIGGQAFYGCSSLKKIKINSKRVGTFGSKAFNKINAKARFYCYASKVSAYRARLKKSGMKNPKISRL